MAELADAPGLGPGIRKDVEVRLLLGAQQDATMVELVYTLSLSLSVERHAGSSPAGSTSETESRSSSDKNGEESRNLQLFN